MQQVDTLLIGIDEARKLREIADLAGVSMQAWVEAKINAAYVMATNHNATGVMQSVECPRCGRLITTEHSSFYGVCAECWKERR
jgi:hypothetical protein